MLIVGLDPGGNGQFGWCVANAAPNGRISLVTADIAPHAAAAVAAVTRQLGANSPLAVAIDSPLFWVANGDRQADRTLRAAMRRVGAPNVGSTVQAVNSLQGACLVQGIMAARLFRQKYPSVRLTESHPKALLWLIKAASERRRARDVKMEDLAPFLDCEVRDYSEHERDAALGAIAAAAMMCELVGWSDLARCEVDSFAPVAPVEYWMPVSAV